MVPNGWRKTDLVDFIEIKHGFAFKSEYFSESGNYILLTPGSFYETGGFKDQGLKTKYYEGEIPESYLLSKGDLLVAMTEQAAGLLGSTLFVPDNSVYLHNQRLGKIVIKTHELVAYEFLYLTYNAPYVRKQISAQSTGTKVKHTSPDKLKSVICLLPPKCEQTKIAKIISTWDKAISTTEHLINNSKQQKKALMQQLLTGKKRLLDDSGKPFEGEWEHGYLGDLCTFKGGSAFKEIYQGEKTGDYPFIKVSDMNLPQNNKFINEANNWISTSIAKEIKAKAFPAGAIVFAKVGAALLLNRRRILSRETIVDNNMMAAMPSEICTTDFLYQLMLAIDFAKFVQEGAVPSVNQSDLSKFKLSYPSKSEQQKIAVVLTNADKEIDLLEQQLSDLKQEKKALMQQLLTGKRRVKTDEEAAYE